MAYRYFDSHIKSLLHFDYPYYAEPNDGLLDEILGTVWKRHGNVKLTGTEQPVELVTAGTPKFGYRCLSTTTSTDYILTANNVYSLNATSSYEWSFYVRPVASQAGNILSLYNGSTQVFAIGIDSNLHITVTSASMNLAVTSAFTLSQNVWHSVGVRLGIDNVSIVLGTDSTTASVSSRVALTVSEARIGGINGQIDEFVFRDTFSSSLPAQPVQGHVNINSMQGFGNGAHGDLTLTSGTTVLNSIFNKASNTWNDRMTFNGTSEGIYGRFSVGDEVMFYVTDAASTMVDYLHRYYFARVRTVTGSLITFSPGMPYNGNIQGWTGITAIKVPNFRNVTIGPNAIVTPPPASGLTQCGLVIFKCTGDCTISGKILTSGTGFARYGLFQGTHGSLLDRFEMNTGGGVIIICGGTLTLTSTARIGASWDGSLKGGSGGNATNGGNGGAGYGGGGAGDWDNYGRGASGVVGGGGGGGNQAVAPSTWTGTTGGPSGGWKLPGGTQGVDVGGNAPEGWGDVGGGGAGGNGAIDTGWSPTPASSGSSVILICKTLKADMSAISTGGQGGFSTKQASGGGGTGFCYIACERMA